MAPQRLRGVERRDDPHVAAVEACHERGVRECEQDPGGDERPRRRARDRPGDVPAGDHDVQPRRQRRRQQRHCGRLERRDVVVARDPAHGVVATGEERRARQRQHDADRPVARRPTRVEGERRAAGDDQAPCRRASTGRTGSSSSAMREQHGAQGRGPDQDRRAGRARVADGEDEEELRHARDEEPDRRERPQSTRHPARRRRRTAARAARRRRTRTRDHDAAEGGIAAAQEPGADGDRHGAEQRARQQAQQDCVHALQSVRAGGAGSRPRSSLSRAGMSGRAVAGGSAVGFSAGWNIADTGAIADDLADAYGISLGVIGLFTRCSSSPTCSCSSPPGA